MKRNTIIWLVLILLHALAFAYQLVHKTPYLVDSKNYLQEAENIKNHFTFYCFPLTDPLDLRAYSLRPPLYPLFLAILKSVWNSDLFVLFIQNLLSLFNLGIILKFLKPEMLAKKQFIYLLLALVFFPAQAMYANLIMSEILLQTCLVLFFYTCCQLLQFKRFSKIWWAALWLSLAILTKPVMQFFALIFLAAAIYFAVKEKKKYIVAGGMLPLLVLLGFSFRNYLQTGYYHFSSIKEVNLLHYNTALLLQNKYDLAYSDSVITGIETQALKQPDFRAQQQFINDACNQILAENFGPYLKFHLKGIVHFFIDPGRFDLFSFFQLESQNSEGFLNIFNSRGYSGILDYLANQPFLILLYLLLIFFFNTIRLILYLRFILIPGRQVWVQLFTLVLIGYLALLTGPLGASRFLVPVFPIMLFAAVAAFRKRSPVGIS